MLLIIFIIFFDFSREKARSIFDSRLILPNSKYTTKRITKMILHKKEKNVLIPDNIGLVIEKS